MRADKHTNRQRDRQTDIDMLNAVLRA